MSVLVTRGENRARKFYPFPCSLLLRMLCCFDISNIVFNFETKNIIMKKNVFETNNVFGVSNEEIYTYIEREKVDSLFLEGLTKNKHIIIYGSSKQGKTALTNKHLQPQQYIRANCSSKTTAIDLYRSILRQLNVEYEESRIQTNSIGGDSRFEIKAKLKIPYLMDVEGGSSVGGNGTTVSEHQYKTVEYNLELAQDVSELLKSIGFNKRIIIENFHYLETV